MRVLMFELLITISGIKSAGGHQLRGRVSHLPSKVAQRAGPDAGLLPDKDISDLPNLPGFKRGPVLGIYSWDPRKTRLRSVKAFRDVTAEEVLAAVKLDCGPPPQLVDPGSVQVPLPFASKAPERYPNRFPNDAGYIVPLHVAVKKGYDLSKIDFLLGGSSLAFFATQTQKSYLAQKVPGTDTIIMAKSNFYVQDYSAPSFQFEQLMTGSGIREIHELEKFENLHLMQIGDFSVLFSAEVDAVDSLGRLVEVKLSTPQAAKSWELARLMQLLASRAELLVTGMKRGTELQSIEVKSVKQILESYEASVWDEASKSVLSALEYLKSAKLGTTTVSVHFDSAKNLALRAEPEGDLLPSPSVVERLLAT